MRFVLGIANFNKNYGFANKINSKNINLILKEAKKFKVKEIDTANIYKKSNKILSKNKYKKNFLINTKISIVKGNDYKKKIKNEIEAFKKNLNLKEINTLFFHDRRQIFEKNIKNIIKYILELKKKKIIKKFGFSIYNKNELKKILSLSEPDVIQVPGNIFDQRFLNKKQINTLKKKKIEVQIRSIFLQGASLKRFYPLKDKKSLKILTSYWKKIDSINLNPLNYNVNFLKKFTSIDKFVVSFENENQFKDLLLCFKKKNKKLYNNGFKTNYTKLINPYLWKKI
ncbi:MAG: hypothetical protein CL824_02280 [Crocinitomicaceae bacterium]|nr:hypothetical protein [Crocinitomicaceae bacterium]